MSRWIWLISGILLGADWLRRSLRTAFGMAKLADVTSPEWDRLPRPEGPQPTVAVIVPARNEGATINRCLRSLIAQDYPNLQTLAVDDRSTDATGSIMDEVETESPGKLRVLHISELPPGWLGKTHAMWRGASETQSDWILFTDGDVIFREDALRRTLAYGESTLTDHLVVFPTLIMNGFGERMMLGFFGIASSLLLRPWRVKDRDAPDFIGAGAFNLIRRRAYEKLGTYQALRMEVIDDLRLGGAVKGHRLRQDCVVGNNLVRLRWAEGALGVVRNLRKNAFSLLHFRWRLAVLASIAAAIYQLGPWVGLGLAPGIAKFGFGVGVFSIALLYWRMGRQFGMSAWFFLTHPLSTVMFICTLLNSAISSLVHGGIVWRGTTYPLEEVRAFSAERRKEMQRMRDSI
ncbi:MAG: family 2 glycosyl transferase [Acidobacteria bacterium]|nr:MAG: family 2 glycosyl transferase [Acidobacteriota bacterium]